MMFLEYCCERMLGPAVGSHYECPFCGHYKLSVRPPKGRHPIKFRCWWCDKWGDQFDIAEELFPHDHFGQRRVRIAALKIDYQRDVKPVSESTTYTLRGGTMTENEFDLITDCFADEADKAIEELMAFISSPVEPDQLQTQYSLPLGLIKRASEICAQHNIHPAAFAARCGHHREWLERTARHIAECGDPDCNFSGCLRDRGWTEEEIQGVKDEIERDRMLNLMNR